MDGLLEDCKVKKSEEMVRDEARKKRSRKEKRKVQNRCGGWRKDVMMSRKNGNKQARFRKPCMSVVIVLLEEAGLLFDIILFIPLSPCPLQVFDSLLLGGGQLQIALL